MCLRLRTGMWYLHFRVEMRKLTFLVLHTVWHCLYTSPRVYLASRCEITEHVCFWATGELIQTNYICYIATFQKTVVEGHSTTSQYLGDDLPVFSSETLVFYSMQKQNYQKKLQFYLLFYMGIKP
jgi:hypothetical protein